MPKLQISDFAEDLERTRAKLIVDVGMIGKEKDGKRIFVPEVVQFFKGKVENNANALVDDALYYARVCEWLDPSESGFDLLNWIEGKKRGWWKVHYYRADFLFRRGNRDAAFLEIQKAVAAAPYRAEPLWLLAFFHNRSSNSSEADRVGKQADAVSDRRKQISRMER
jgi:hypothetical protein